MTDAPDLGRDRPTWLTAFHSLSVGELRRSHEIASRTNLHEDTMLIWGDRIGWGRNLPRCTGCCVH